MAALIGEFRATYAFMERNANLVKRYWSWELVFLAYSIANSLSVSFIGLGMEQIGGGQNVDGRFLVLYLVVGTLVWRYLSLIFYWITDVIGMERWEGTIEYTLMAPIRRITHMAGQTLWSVIYSLISTGIILLVTVLIFDIDLSRANLWGGLVMMLAGSLSFIGVGIVGSILPLLFPERRLADDACDHRPDAAGFGRVLSGERAAAGAAKDGGVLAGDLCAGRHTPGAAGRHADAGIVAAGVANADHGLDRHPGGAVGVWAGGALCQAHG